jgi:hypothetical protein
VSPTRVDRVRGTRRAPARVPSREALHGVTMQEPHGPTDHPTYDVQLAVALREEIRAAQGVRSELMKWKLVAIGGLTAAALGVGAQGKVRFEWFLCVIPLLCGYIDLLCCHLDLKTQVIGESCARETTRMRGSSGRGCGSSSSRRARSSCRAWSYRSSSARSGSSTRSSASARCSWSRAGSASAWRSESGAGFIPCRARRTPRFREGHRSGGELRTRAFEGAAARADAACDRWSIVSPEGRIAFHRPRCHAA